MDVLEQNVVGANVLDFNAKNVGKFLNRILGLEVNKQNLVIIWTVCLWKQVEIRKCITPCFFPRFLDIFVNAWMQWRKLLRKREGKESFPLHVYSKKGLLHSIYKYIRVCTAEYTYYIETLFYHFRYNDGVTDIRGNSITLTGQPRVVFKEAQLGSSVTRSVKISR